MTQSKIIKRRGFQQFWLGICLYTLLIVPLNIFAGPLKVSEPVMVALTFVPILAALWGMLGWLRAIKAMDELQQRIITESAQWALGLTGLATFSYGLLEQTAQLPRLSVVWVWPFINLVFALAHQLIVRRRYG